MHRAFDAARDPFVELSTVDQLDLVEVVVHALHVRQVLAHILRYPGSLVVELQVQQPTSGPTNDRIHR